MLILLRFHQQRPQLLYEDRRLFLKKASNIDLELLRVQALIAHRVDYKADHNLILEAKHFRQALSHPLVEERVGRYGWLADLDGSAVGRRRGADGAGPAAGGLRRLEQPSLEHAHLPCSSRQD